MVTVDAEFKANTTDILSFLVTIQWLLKHHLVQRNKFDRASVKTGPTVFVCNNVWCDSDPPDSGLTQPFGGSCFTLDPYGSGSWGPQSGPPHSHHQHHPSPGASSMPHWCERPGRSQDPPALGGSLGGSFAALGSGREVLSGAPLGGGIGGALGSCPGGSLRQLDSPYHVTCPVHSPYRFRFANGGPEYYGHHHQVIR